MKQRWRFTKNKLHPKPEFFEGQKVVIIRNTCGHWIPNGRVVTLTYAEPNHTIWWDLEAEYKNMTNYFDEDDCKPYEGDK